MQKAVIYARYSSSAQRDVSIDQQVTACRRYAEGLGLEVLRVYEDRALTGRTDARPGFQMMIRDAAKADWEYVVVYALDRFARDRYDSVVYKRKLKDHGIRVISAMEHITDDPTGVLMESILEGFAEYYSKELAQKTQRGMLDNARKCMVNGVLPVGYKKAPDGRYAIEEAEAELIREIFRRVSDGETVTELLADFARRELRTSRGTPWTRNIMYKALANERYTGVYIYGDIRIEGGVPEIIPRELFDAVQLCLGAKKNPKKINGVPQRRRQENGTYLLTGKLYCGDCKSPMVGVSGYSKNKSPYFYYACQTHRKAAGCDRPAIRREVIEKLIAEALQKYVLNDETIIALADALVAYQAEQNGSLELQSLQAQLREVNKSIGNIMKAIENGLYAPTMQARLNALETEQQQLTARIRLLQPKQQHIVSKKDIILMLTACRHGDVEDPLYRQMLLDSFLIRAYLYDDHLKLQFTITEDREATIDHALPDKIFPESGAGEPLCSYNPPSGPPPLIIRTKTAQIVSFSGLFWLQCAYCKDTRTC